MGLNVAMSKGGACKALIVGDGAIGKTCLLSRFTNDAIEWDNDGEPEYEPTTFNNFILNWKTDEGEELEVEMWDTAGQEAFEQLRKLSYPGTDIFLVGYSTISTVSLNNIEHKWVPEIKESNSPKPWIIVVGTKADLRESQKDKAVAVSAAEDMAKKIEACALIDTSAKCPPTDPMSNVTSLTKMMTKLALMKRNGQAKPTFGFDGAGAAPAAAPAKAPAAKAPAAKAPAAKPAAAPSKPAAAPTAAKTSSPHTNDPASSGKSDDSGCSCVIA